ncbi:hypothetical protein FJY84_08485 [Candidatus Bathyarchaeota archaeon]|nr:hypothetical protein [Candidatus Bathyarchaeota archaeon]
MGIENNSLPTAEGIYQAIHSLGHRLEDSRLTDLLGNAGVHLVFPEFSPIAHNLQHLITLGHQVDHINDEGPFFTKKKDRSNNLATFNLLYSDFVRLHRDNPYLLRNIVSFLSQAAMVESVAHSWTNPTETDIINYRELVTAIWARMIVSYGTGLTIGYFDPIGNQANVTAGYRELQEAYSPYIRGEEIDNLPGGKKNYVLFMWTMAIQDEFDRIFASDNRQRGIPAFQSSESRYRGEMRRFGIKPLIFAGTILLTGLVVKTKDMKERLVRKFNNKGT